MEERQRQYEREYVRPNGQIISPDFEGLERLFESEPDPRQTAIERAIERINRRLFR